MACLFQVKWETESAENEEEPPIEAEVGTPGTVGPDCDGADLWGCRGFLWNDVISWIKQRWGGGGSGWGEGQGGGTTRAGVQLWRGA